MGAGGFVSCADDEPSKALETSRFGTQGASNPISIVTMRWPGIGTRTTVRPVGRVSTRHCGKDHGEPGRTVGRLVRGRSLQVSSRLLVDDG